MKTRNVLCTITYFGNVLASDRANLALDLESRDIAARDYSNVPGNPLTIRQAGSPDVTGTDGVVPTVPTGTGNVEPTLSNGTVPVTDGPPDVTGTGGIVPTVSNGTVPVTAGTGRVSSGMIIATIAFIFAL